MMSRSSGIAITLILRVTKPALLSPLVQRSSCKHRRVAQLLLDAQELVVLGDAVAARGRAGLDLPRVRGHGEVGDGGVLGLAGAMRDDVAVAGALGHLDRVERLGERADLIQLDENRVADAPLDAFGA